MSFICFGVQLSILCLCCGLIVLSFLVLPTDKEKWIQGDPICREQVTGRCQGKEENQGTSKGKRLRRTSKATVEPSGPVCMKPSCPTKKRVQVARYPLPETPSQPTKLEGGTVKNTTTELKSSSVVIKENSGINKEGTVFSPFFWLRDDEGREKSSQHTEADAYITPPEVPSFSDLKDSEDISSSELSPTVSSLIYLVLVIVFQLDFLKNKLSLI